jgi:hypothetical protein
MGVQLVAKRSLQVAVFAVFSARVSRNPPLGQAPFLRNEIFDYSSFVNAAAALQNFRVLSMLTLVSDTTPRRI